MDTVSLNRIELVHPKLRDELRLVFAEANGALTGRAKCRITQTLRTFEQQAALFAQGRTKPGKRVTNARPGESFHNYGLAVDFCLIVDNKQVSWDMTKDYDQDHIADWKEVVRVFKNHCWSWGGDWKVFKDFPHFEKTFGLSEKDCQRLYYSGKQDQYGYIIL